MSERITRLFYEAANDSMESKEELLKDLYPLIVSSISKYYKGDEDFEDLVQEGKIMILDCIRTFDDKLNVPFLGYVKSKLKYLYLSSEKRRIQGSLNLKVGEEDLELMDLIPGNVDIEGDILKSEEITYLKECIDKLPKRQNEIITDFYFREMSIEKISKKYNLTYRTILNTKSNGLSYLRRELKRIYD